MSSTTIKQFLTLNLFNCLNYCFSLLKLNYFSLQIELSISLEKWRNPSPEETNQVPRK